MFENQENVQAVEGTSKEMEALDGGLEQPSPGGLMLVAAADDGEVDNAEASGTAVAAPDGEVEIAMSLLGAMLEDQVAGLKFSDARTRSSSISEAGGEALSSDTQIRQALGIHQASVGGTDFLDRAMGDDFGMTEFREWGSFSAARGDDLAGRGIEDEIEWEGLAWFRNSPQDESLLVIGTVDLGDIAEDTSMLITEARLLATTYAPAGVPLSVTDLRVTDGSGVVTDNGDGTWTFTPAPDWNGNVALGYRISDGASSYVANAALTVNPVNDAPFIAVNDVLLVDDLTSQSLAGSLSATDVDNDAADLWYTITQGPVSGVLLLDGVAVIDFSQPVFTQADIDGGRVTFRFDTPQPGDEFRVIEDDSFVFTVDDGSLSTAETTFHIHNTTVQIWGTNGADDLTGAADFSREGVTFHVYGFDGNDTMRGGSGADTLDGGGHAYAQHSPWLYTQEGGDTVDYGASTAAVDIDLTRAAQAGGHAEGDVLIGIENVVGSGFSDSITGDAAANFLSGLDGNDTLLGGAGNDTLRGGAGADLIDGGVGQDFADYRDSESWVNVDLNIQDGTTAQSGGGVDNDAEGDTLIGIENLIGSNDATHGDVLTGNAANNHLIGLDGDDTLIGGAGNDTFVGGAGADILDGGTGTRDLADYSASTAWVNVDLTFQDGITAQSGGGAGNHAEGDILTGIEDVNGSQYGDSLTGNGGHNRIWAYDGADTIYGGAGRDTIYGGDGHDWIDGGSHEDYIVGGEGNDTINGGTGIDSIYGGAGDDYLYGGAGDYQDQLIGGAGNDTLEGGSIGLRDTLVGGMGADRIIGNGVRASASYELTGDGHFEVSYQGVYVDLRLQGPDADGNLLVQPGKPGGDDATGDILTGIVHVVGSNGADTLIGDHLSNQLDGSDGIDLLIGNEGNDSLEGGGGNDTLEGGLGADYMRGGGGYDIVTYANAASGVNVSLDIQIYGVQSGAGEENGDLLAYISGLFGSEFNDTLTGGSWEQTSLVSRHNRIEGRGGDDIISGLAGNDTLDGGEGNDTLIGGEGDDLLLGGAGDDLIHAGAGDTVDGGEGYDVLLFEDAQLDVTASTTLSSIERIDLTGGGERLTVVGDAIVANGVLDPAGDGAYMLMVTGDIGDVVDYSGDDWAWSLSAQNVDLGDGWTYAVHEAEKDGQTVRLYVRDVLAVDAPGNDAPAVAVNAALSADDAAVVSLAGSLIAMDAESSASELRYTITQGPAYGTLLLNGAVITDFSVIAFTQDDIDSGRVEFAFTATPGTEVRVFAEDSFSFTVTDGENATAEATFSIGNTVTQVWGTNAGDDLTSVADFDEVGSTFHVYGFDGDDFLVGGAGNDTLVGGLGYDTLEGGDGDDWFQDGVGYYDNTYTGDSLVGGAGIDTVDYSNSLDVCMVDLTDSWYSFPNSSSSDAYCDTLVGIENIVGSRYFDSLLGDGEANVIRGEGGWDYILGRGGDDTLLGGADNDTLDGGADNDFIDGGADNDLLIGGGGSDTILGGTGDDLIRGGADDVVDGGSGFDTFRLEDNIGAGSIFDLSAMNDAGRITGIERIDITGGADDANTLTLRAEDVFEVSGGSLYVDGDAGDSVTTSGAGWTQEAGDVSYGGQTYHHYTAQYDLQAINLYVETTLAYQNEV
jgi:Ca2+-binding RTX toxin-like protein